MMINKKIIILNIITVLVSGLLSACSGISQEQYKQVNDNLNAAQAQIQSLQNNLNSTQNDLTKSQGQTQSLQTILNNTQNDLTKSQDQAQSLKKNLDAAQSQIQTMQKDGDASKAQIESLQARLNSAQSELSKVQTQIQSVAKVKGYAELLDLILYAMYKQANVPTSYTFANDSEYGMALMVKATSLADTNITKYIGQLGASGGNLTTATNVMASMMQYCIQQIKTLSSVNPTSNPSSVGPKT